MHTLYMPDTFPAWRQGCAVPTPVDSRSTCTVAFSVVAPKKSCDATSGAM
eukprot:gene203-3906_t